MKYSYYPGCSLKGTAKDYNKAIERVVELLKLDVKELPDWVCCGASPTHVPDEKLNLAIPAIDLAQADKIGHDVITACAACFNRLKGAKNILDADQDKKNEIEGIIGEKLTGKARIRHFLEVMVGDISTDVWKSSIKKELKGLKVASYYGCLLSRPKNIIDGIDMEDPQLMDDLIRILGAEPVDWFYKTECCGGSFAISKTEVVIKLSGKILQAAHKAGADCVVVACPLCQANLDMRQKEINHFYNDKLFLPIFYFPELIAIALGDNYENLALNMHMVDALPLLKLKELI